MFLTDGRFIIPVIIVIVILHCVFLYYGWDTNCGRNADLNDFKAWQIWSILLLPLFIVFAFYTLIFRICRSFLCSCWQLCGNDMHGKCATKCKIFFEGVIGNPLIFAVIFIIWGLYEFTQFGAECNNNSIKYGYLIDLILVSIALLYICIYWFIRVKRKMVRKRNRSKAEKDQKEQKENHQINGYENNHNNHNNNIQLQQQQHYNNNHNHNMEQEGSGQPLAHQPQFPQNRRFSADHNMIQRPPNQRQPYGMALSVGHNENIPAYDPNQNRRHSFNPNARPKNDNPLLVFGPPKNIRNQNSVPSQSPPIIHEIQPYPNNNNQNNQNNNNNNNNNNNEENSNEASIEIEVELDDDNDVVSVHNNDDNHNNNLKQKQNVNHTRGISVSFPSNYKGHARNVSTKIYNILQNMNHECTICMSELEKHEIMAQLECGHVFHKECVIDWFKNDETCPVCRESIVR